VIALYTVCFQWRQCWLPMTVIHEDTKDTKTIHLHATESQRIRRDRPAEQAGQEAVNEKTRIRRHGERFVSSRSRLTAAASRRRVESHQTLGALRCSLWALCLCGILFPGRAERRNFFVSFVSFVFS
jgi:hypothetical protein